MADQLTKVMTVNYPSRMRQIPTACGVVHSYLSGGTSEVTEFKALWDTGADGSVVSNSVVAALGLMPDGKIPVYHADGMSIVNVYTVDWMMGGACGMSVGQSPSGAICAGFESIEVLDGTAYLGVAVKTNVNLTAEAQDWGKVGLKAKDVSVENGSVIIAVPANTEQGFFYLMSKPAVPSDKGGVPFRLTPRLMSGKWQADSVGTVSVRRALMRSPDWRFLTQSDK